MADAFDLPFREQAEFWRRKVNVPTATWRDMQREDHAHGFMVAGAARQDLLDGLRQAVDKAVAGNGTIEQFRRDFDDIVARAGWQYNGGRNWRTRIIYETNLRTAYQAGRWQQMQAIKSRRPYWQYVHNDVRHPRPMHVAWNGKVLSADDPWWSTHYPPNGYGCKCTVHTLAQRDMDRMGKAGPDDAPTPVDDTAGLDPGFDYNVGTAASSMPAAVRFGQKLQQLPPAWRDISLADAQKRAADYLGDWPLTVARVVDELAAGQARPQGAAHALGFLRTATARALEAGVDADGRQFAGQAPSTALLGGVDNQLYHAVRDIKDDRQLIIDNLADLPAWLADPATGVLYDAGEGGRNTQPPALIYVRKLGDGRLAKLVFSLDQRADNHRPLRQARLAANWLRTVSVIEEGDLHAPSYHWLERAE